MRIHVLAVPIDTLIAREEVLGDPEGEFHVSSAGTIVYRHPADTRDWWAGESLEQFTAAAAAWDDYSSHVSALPEPQQIHAVQALGTRLSSIGVLTDDRSVWASFLEQAEAGLL
jgi:hypothetical protein